MGGVNFPKDKSKDKSNVDSSTVGKHISVKMNLNHSRVFGKKRGKC